MTHLRAWAASALAWAALLGIAGPSWAAPTYSVGPDTLGVGRVLGAVAPGSSTAVATLGDGSVAFNGGLAYSGGTGQFYAIGNDSVGASSLYAFSAASPGSFTLSQGLSVGGFTGGLAMAGTTLYAISNDANGFSSLYSMNLGGGGLNLLGTLAGALYTGLTFDADDGLLYGIAADASGVGRSLRRIDLAGGLSDVALFELGDGSLAFNGGLAYDAQADLFHVIANDAAAASTLMSFDLSGAASLAAQGGSFGVGYVNAGLVLGPESVGGGGGTPLPEPATALLLLATALAWALARHTAPRHPTPPALA